jgi:hypothetical protein
MGLQQHVRDGLDKLSPTVPVLTRDGRLERLVEQLDWGCELLDLERSEYGRGNSGRTGERSARPHKSRFGEAHLASERKQAIQNGVSD